MRESIESFVKAEAAGQTWLRHSPRPEDTNLLPHTKNWLAALPKYARPVHLHEDFPRIANGLCSRWDETPALDLYFEEKEFSPRKGRQGFRPLIEEELLALRVYSWRGRPVSHLERSPKQAFLLR